MKKMFRLAAIILSLTAVSAIIPTAVFAENKTSGSSAGIAEKYVSTGSVLTYGTVESVLRDGKGNILSVTIQTDEKGRYTMNCSENTAFIDNSTCKVSDISTLKKGESIYVFHSEVMTFSLPPQSAAYVVIRNTAMDAQCGMLHTAEKVSVRQNKLTITTDSGSLKLKTDAETVLTDINGNLLKTDAVQEGMRFISWGDGEKAISTLLLLPEKQQETGGSAIAKGGWFRQDDDWYYVGKEGVCYAERWAEIGGKWYWFNEDGIMMQNGWKELSGKWYYFTASGAAAKDSWIKDKGKWYYLDSTCAWDSSAVPFVLKVDGTALELPAQPYYVGNTLMVPAKATAQAMNLTVTEDGKGGLTLADTTQEVTLAGGEETAAFKGKLQILDFTRTVALSAKSSVKDGVLYLPLDFFTEFYAETSVSGKEAVISRNLAHIN